MPHRITIATLLIVLAAALAACEHVEDQRIPPAAVYISFVTEADWVTYGVPGALDHRRFIKSERIPQNYPYTQLTQTGYGGVLLVGDINGTPLAYDLACPVENRADIRVAIDPKTHEAVCPVCHSHYSVFTNFGVPLSGRAKELNYGLRRYNVGPGGNGEYRIITR